MTGADRPAAAAGTFAIGGEMTVNRLGFGAMQLTGPGVWGEPSDPSEAVRVLRRAVELGVNFVDTADSYGPEVSERLIRRALHPYPDDLVIATKAGLTRPGPGSWVPNGRPEHLRRQVEHSLNLIGIERLALLQLHRIDPAVPLAESLGELGRLQAEGKIGHIGLSEVSVDELEQARRVTVIASVQNHFNLMDRTSEPVLDVCAAHGIAFIPWIPLATGALARPGGQLSKIAAVHRVRPAQVALAWLLARDQVMLPIPGTSKVAHVEENVAAAALELSADELRSLSESFSIGFAQRLRFAAGRLSRRRSS